MLLTTRVPQCKHGSCTLSRNKPNKSAEFRPDDATPKSLSARISRKFIAAEEFCENINATIDEGAFSGHILSSDLKIYVYRSFTKIRTTDPIL